MLRKRIRLLFVILLFCIMMINVDESQAADKKVKYITLNVKSKKMMVEDGFYLNIKSVKPIGASKRIKCSSSNEKVASVKKDDSSGKDWIVIANNPGTAKITAVSASNKNVKAVCKIVVKKIAGSYKNTKWSIDKNGCLIVKGKGDMFNPNERPSWLRYNHLIKSAKIEVTGATSLRNMFSGCNKMESVDISKLDTSKVTNMSSMFYLCKSLKNIDLSKFDTSQVTNMSFLFYKCNNLMSLDLSGFKTVNVQNMTCMFSNCENLKTLDLSSFNTSQVSNMGYMFYKCNVLQSLDLSSFDFSKINYMKYMFYECNNLTNIDIRNFNASKVTDMSYMFYECNNLRSLDISKLDTSKVTNMRCMFCRCNNLTNIDVSNFNTSEVTDMGCMFSECEKIKELDLSNFNTSKVTAMNEMFNGCDNLKKLDIRNFNFSKVENYSYIELSCLYSLSEIVSPAKISDVNIELPTKIDVYNEISNFYWTDCDGNEYSILPLNTKKSLTLIRKIKGVDDIEDDEEYNGPSEIRDISNPRITDNETVWDCIYFGSYYKNTIDKKEPIKWRVLSVNGDEALLVSDKVLDDVVYIDSLEDEESLIEPIRDFSWKNSFLRTWLNNDFLKTAFDENEEKAIKETTLLNNYYIPINNDVSNKIIDKIFLLSYEDVSNELYGFKDNSVYLECKPTHYAAEKTYISDDIDYMGNCGWWLLPYGDYDSYLYNYSIDINIYGRIGWSNNDTESSGVRPALYINLSSSCWRYAGTVTCRASNRKEELYN